MTNIPSAPSMNDAEPADLFDFKQIAHYCGFVLGAFKRHRLLALGIFCLIVSISFLALWLIPKSYHVDTRISAQRNQVMSPMAGNGRTVPWDSDGPTRAASETILRRDNLIALIKQTNLVDQWESSRAPLQRGMDLVRGLLGGAPSEEDKLEALVGVLEKKLRVIASEGSLSIEIDWTEPQMAYRLVEAAQQNFLEARHAMEVSTIAEVISILEGHAASVHDNIQAALNEIQQAREKGSGGAAAHNPTGVRSTRTARARPTADHELERIKVMVSAKRRAIEDLEDFRRRKLAELQTQLAEQKATYAAAHPTILNTEASIAALSKDSVQIANLKKEEADLLDEIARHGGKGSNETEPAPVVAAPLVPEGIQQARGSGENESEGVEYGKAQLRIATRKYEELLDRVDAARIELDTARAAFKYRYNVIKPPQVPKRPEKPKPAMIVAFGLFAGIFFAFFAAAVVDIRRGLIVEPWQIERVLELPVLCEVKWGE